MSGTHRREFRQVMTATVAATIARERSSRGMTISMLAERAGISSGLLSQLERGIGNPSLKTIYDVSRALDLPINSFFDEASLSESPVVRHEARNRLIFTKDLTYALLVPDLLGSIGMFEVELPPNFSNAEAPFQHEGEEVELVLSGTIEVHLDDEVHLLRARDSIRFKSTVPHWYRTFDEPCVMIWAQTPPSF